MKKFLTIQRVLGLMTIVALATVFTAAPAFAASVNQVSIDQLVSTLDGGNEPVPEPRRFTLITDFADDVTSDGEHFPSDGEQYTFDGTEPHQNIQLRGRGPHGGYTTTSAKCAVCHSAHSAQITENSNDLTLVSRGNSSLQRQGATSCEFCHLTGTPIGGTIQSMGAPEDGTAASTNVVYTGGMGGASQITDLASGHSLLEPGVTIPNSVLYIDLNAEIDGADPNWQPSNQMVTITDGLTCSTCHAVHGNVGTWQPTDFFRGEVTDPIYTGNTFEEAGEFSNSETTDEIGYKLLRANPGAVANPGVSAPATEAEDNDDPIFSTDQDQVNQFTMNVWCASCHNSPALDKEMTTIRSALEDTGEWVSRVATFQATGEAADLHNVTGGYANLPGDDGDFDTVVNEPHATSFIGVYSGPGQCYTCHRGDMANFFPATAWLPQGDPEGNFEPLGDDDNPALADLARLRALGYFSLEETSGTSSANLLEQQARTLACGSCHFGTADYARWAPQSDWPHRSPDTDTMLLGLNLTEDQQNEVRGPGNSPRLPADIATEQFCSRCHIGPASANGENNLFLISHHEIAHGGLNNDGVTGTLPAPPGPGFVPGTDTTQPDPSPSDENTSTSTEPTTF